ncbi:MAG: AraC family ligand binding domain-containing protein, partial [Chitinivibrionales bacterium]|nr:AraC family ligand binding domain-containing protein [Chitinivibrionales bacterium]
MSPSLKPKTRQNRPFVKIGELQTHRFEDIFPIIIFTDYEKTDSLAVPLHFHNCLEIGYCQKGSGISIIADDAAAYKSGDILVIREYEPHLSRSDAGTVS